MIPVWLVVVLFLCMSSAVTCLLLLLIRSRVLHQSAERDLILIREQLRDQGFAVRYELDRELYLTPVVEPLQSIQEY